MERRSAPKAQQIYEFMRRAIILLEMAPGSAVIEKDICLANGVSRTPVREAVQKLADEGLVIVVPQSGTYVSRISFQLAEEGFVIRRALEIEGVRRAALRSNDEAVTRLQSILDRMRRILADNALATYLSADDEFHGSIAELSGMTRLWRYISMAKVDLDRMRQLSAPIPGHLERVTRQHEQIVDAIRRGSPDQSELAMRIHLESSFEVMASMIKGSDDMFVGGAPLEVV
jgi:DNA-binding GntR family transcriptional regulator